MLRDRMKGQVDLMKKIGLRRCPRHTGNKTTRFRRLALLAAVLLVVAGNAAADTLSGRVVRVIDGDTLVLLLAGNVQERIRLAGIDCPERGQAFGTKAKEALAGRVAGKTVEVEWDKRDRYRRVLGRAMQTSSWCARGCAGGIAGTPRSRRPRTGGFTRTPRMRRAGRAVGYGATRIRCRPGNGENASGDGLDTGGGRVRSHRMGYWNSGGTPPSLPSGHMFSRCS